GPSARVAGGRTVRRQRIRRLAFLSSSGSYGLAAGVRIGRTRNGPLARTSRARKANEEVAYGHRRQGAQRCSARTLPVSCRREADSPGTVRQEGHAVRDRAGARAEPQASEELPTNRDHGQGTSHTVAC